MVKIKFSQLRLFPDRLASRWVRCTVVLWNPVNSIPFFSCSPLTRTWELMKLSCKLSLVNSHATLVLFDQGTRVDETLMQTLARQLPCNSCSRLTRTWELIKLSCKLWLANSHATLVLVWPGHESWWNSHANSRSSTPMQLLFSFDQKDESWWKSLTLPTLIEAQCLLS